MAEINLKDLIKDNYVTFLSYKKGFFYYNIKNYIFPVPVDDIGDGELLHTDKAIMFMRWIRKAIQEGTLLPE